MAFVAEATVTVGQVLTAAIWNLNVRDNVNYLANPPHARVYNSANISIANTTVVALTFNSERYDIGTLHSTVTNTGRITFIDPGLYTYSLGVAFAANVTGHRLLAVRLNGATFLDADTRQTITAAGVTTDLHVTGEYQFAAGDYIEAIVYQDSTAALNALAVGNYSPEFSARWVAA